MKTSARTARAVAALALAGVLAACPHAARAARLELPVRGTAGAGSGAQLAAERVVIRLLPDVARAARLDPGAERDPRRLALRRPPVLAALGARLSGAWFEPEFPDEASGRDPVLAAFWIAHLPGGLPLGAALDRARAAAEVVEASPIVLEPLEALAAAGTGALPGLAAAAPNDSLWSLSWYLYQASRRDIHALEAWDVTRGDSTSVIAVLDTGVLRDHPDLSGTDGGWGNIWTNRAELLGAPGVDDDGNGYVDDRWGWDFVTLDSASFARVGEDWQDADNDPNDFAVHGTAVSGVIAAIANNRSGVAGVAPGAKVMAVRTGYSAPWNPAGVVDLSWASQGIVYAVRNGATVINCSFASDQQPDLLAAVNAATAAGVSVVTAAGNGGDPHHYLGDREDVISVAATDDADKVTLFSSRYPSVDLAAPGQAIATTTLRATGTDSIGLRQGYYSPSEAGTSFSSPMVAAAVALVQTDRRARGLRPLTPALALLRVAETADDIAARNSGIGYGSGRLNVFRALTDPPHSVGFPTRAPTVGSAAILPTQSGSSWVAWATADSGLLVTRAPSCDTVARVALAARPVGGVAAADLGAGRGAGIFVALENGRIAGFTAGGVPLPGWPVDATGVREEPDAMPCVGDLDGDGASEIVWGGSDGSVWAWHADGSRVAGFPRHLGTPGRNVRVALADLDGVPGDEIVAACFFRVTVLGADGTPRPGWPIVVELDPGAPLVTRLGGQSAPVIVFACDSLLHARRADGSPVFRQPLASHVVQDLAAGDLNGDGREEIVALQSLPDVISVVDSAGTVIASRTLTVHSWGPPLVAPLIPGTTAQILFTGPDPLARSRLLALGSTLADLAGWPKAGHASDRVSLGDADGDGATDIAAGSGSDSVAYLYESVPGSWRPAAAAWPTARGNFARTRSRLGGAGLVAADDVAPAAIADLHGGGDATHAVTLRWSAPADGGGGGVAAYDVRISPTPIDAASFTAAASVPQALLPAAPGAPESLVVEGLPEAATRWFAIRSRDATGNWSPPSASIALARPSEKPAPVEDLQVAGGSDSTLTLLWSATGDDGRSGRAARYVIRLAEAPMDSAAFEAATLGADIVATQDVGSVERATVRGLPRGRRLWIGLRAIDAAGNASALSNEVASTVGRLARIAGAAMLPSRSPSRVPVELEWQGDPAGVPGRQTVEIFDVGGRLQQTFELPHAASGVLVWNGETLHATRARAGLYFTRFRSGPATIQGRIVLLR